MCTSTIWCKELNPDSSEKMKAGREGMTKDEIVGWHHRMNRHEFKQPPGDNEGQAAAHGVTKSQTGLSNWTSTTWTSQNL